MFAQILIIAGAALVMLNGLLHLQGSFFLFDRDLEPSDGELKAQMNRVALNISPKTNLWRAWIGFNAMYALSLLVFGLVFGYLALVRFDELARTPFLLGVGTLYLAGLVVLSWRYLFYLPTLSFALCLVLFGVGSVVALI